MMTWLGNLDSMTRKGGERKQRSLERSEGGQHDATRLHGKGGRDQASEIKAIHPRWCRFVLGDCTARSVGVLYVSTGCDRVLQISNNQFLSTTAKAMLAKLLFSSVFMYTQCRMCRVSLTSQQKHVISILANLSCTTPLASGLSTLYARIDAVVSNRRASTSSPLATAVKSL
eukprot:2184106-Rhodomonas_salina.1